MAFLTLLNLNIVKLQKREVNLYLTYYRNISIKNLNHKLGKSWNFLKKK